VQKVAINRIVKSMRSFADLTQEELAGRVGFSKRAIVDYEGGDSIPPVDKFIEISVACNITPGHIACLLSELTDKETPLNFTKDPHEQELITTQRTAMEAQRTALALAADKIATLNHELEGLRKEMGKGKN